MWWYLILGYWVVHFVINIKKVACCILPEHQPMFSCLPMKCNFCKPFPHLWILFFRDLPNKCKIIFSFKRQIVFLKTSVLRDDKSRPGYFMCVWSLYFLVKLFKDGQKIYNSRNPILCALLLFLLFPAMQSFSPTPCKQEW